MLQIGLWPLVKLHILYEPLDQTPSMQSTNLYHRKFLASLYHGLTYNRRFNPCFLSTLNPVNSLPHSLSAKNFALMQLFPAGHFTTVDLHDHKYTPSNATVK